MALDEFLVGGGQCEVAEPGAAHQSLEDIGDVELVVVPLQAVLTARHCATVGGQGGLHSS